MIVSDLRAGRPRVKRESGRAPRGIPAGRSQGLRPWPRRGEDRTARAPAARGGGPSPAPLVPRGIPEARDAAIRSRMIGA